MYLRGTFTNITFNIEKYFVIFVFVRFTTGFKQTLLYVYRYLKHFTIFFKTNANFIASKCEFN